jgi:hypothetical protein
MSHHLKINGADDGNITFTPSPTSPSTGGTWTAFTNTHHQQPPTGSWSYTLNGSSISSSMSPPLRHGPTDTYDTLSGSVTLDGSFSITHGSGNLANSGHKKHGVITNNASWEATDSRPVHHRHETAEA